MQIGVPQIGPQYSIDTLNFPERNSFEWFHIPLVQSVECNPNPNPIWALFAFVQHKIIQIWIYIDK